MNEQSPWAEGVYASNVEATGSMRPTRALSPIPTFCKVVFIIDLVMASIRGLIVPFSIMGAAMIPSDDPLMASVYFEIAFGVLIAAVAVPANILGLMGKASAYVVGWVNILMTFGGICVGIWQAVLIYPAQIAQSGSGSPESIGFIFGAVIAIAIRAGLAGAMAVSLLRYKTWLNESK